MNGEKNYWSSRVSRRTALRGGVIGAAGLVGAALIGCGDDDDDDAAAPAAAAKPAATAAAAKPAATTKPAATAAPAAVHWPARTPTKSRWAAQRCPPGRRQRSAAPGLPRPQAGVRSGQGQKGGVWK